MIDIIFCERLAEAVQIFAAYIQSGGQNMPAEAVQQRAAGIERVIEVKAAVAAAGALAVAVRQRDHDRWDTKRLGQTGGGNADNALVPALARQYDGRGGGRPGQRLHGLLPYFLLQALALAVHLAKLCGEPTRLGGAFLHHKLGGALHPPKPPCGVDTRRERKADGHGGQTVTVNARLVHEGRKSRPWVVAQLFQSDLQNAAILARQRHNVRHRADGNQIGVAGEHTLVAPVHGADELIGHADACEVAAGVGAVVALGVNDGHRVRKLLLTFVVVGDDHVDTERGGIARLLDGGDAAIDRDDEGNALAFQVLDGGGVEAVALL